TVGKLDAGMAILLTDDNRLVEFPSLLLPAGIAPGHIVAISVMRDPSAERSRHFTFRALQDKILAEFGQSPPANPDLSVRGVTQTSVTLSWAPFDMASADLHRIEVYRDGQRCEIASPPLEQGWVKVTGLEVDKEYELEVRIITTAGTYPSEVLKVRTHALENLSGISVVFGAFERGEQEDAVSSVKAIIERIHGRIVEEVGPDATHVIARVPEGDVYNEANRWNIPVVRPEWIIACEQKGKIQPVGSYYVRVSP
ncbi:hypothetical protein BJ684DRAFT_1985, partial [Piptocephalis cylindrospora]